MRTTQLAILVTTVLASHLLIPEPAVGQSPPASSQKALANNASKNAGLLFQYYGLRQALQEKTQPVQENTHLRFSNWQTHHLFSVQPFPEHSKWLIPNLTSPTYEIHLASAAYPTTTPGKTPLENFQSPWNRDEYDQAWRSLYSPTQFPMHFKPIDGNWFFKQRRPLSIKGRANPGDILRLQCMYLPGIKEYLPLIYVDDMFFVSQDGSRHNASLFAYPFRDGMEYNTFPPRITERYLRKRFNDPKFADAMTKLHPLNLPKKVLGGRAINLDWIVTPLPPLITGEKDKIATYANFYLRNKWMHVEKQTKKGSKVPLYSVSGMLFRPQGDFWIQGGTRGWYPAADYFIAARTKAARDPADQTTDQLWLHFTNDQPSSQVERLAFQNVCGFRRASVKPSSAHFVVGPGAIVQLVNCSSHRSAHAGLPQYTQYNNRSIGIELALRWHNLQSTQPLRCKRISFPDQKQWRLPNDSFQLESKSKGGTIRDVWTSDAITDFPDVSQRLPQLLQWAICDSDDPRRRIPRTFAPWKNIPDWEEQMGSTQERITVGGVFLHRHSIPSRKHCPLYAFGGANYYIGKVDVAPDGSPPNKVFVKFSSDKDVRNWFHNNVHKSVW